LATRAGGHWHRIVAEYVPSLHIAETGGRVRLSLGGLASADGPTLQDAADALVGKVRSIATAIRSGGVGFSSELRVDPAVLSYLWQLAEITEAGGDLREALFDPGAASR
jgi:hypothetical protein